MTKNCSICISNYTLIGGICVPNSLIPVNCLTLNAYNGKCIFCVAGYSLINSICVLNKTCQTPI
jgi:hypothetical protein